MTIMSFNFTKIAAQRLTTQSGKIQIANNIGVMNIESQKFAGDSKRDAVRVSFRYDCKYEPKVAHLQFEGDIVLLLPSAEAKSLVEGWKDKKAPAVSLTSAMNHILERSNVQAILLARDLNLPSPVPLPKVNMDAGKVKDGSVKTSLTKGDEKTAPKKTAEKK